MLVIFVLVVLVILDRVVLVVPVRVVLIVLVRVIVVVLVVRCVFLCHKFSAKNIKFNFLIRHNWLNTTMG